jgi:hypothetical protein
MSKLSTCSFTISIDMKKLVQLKQSYFIIYFYNHVILIKSNPSSLLASIYCSPKRASNVHPRLNPCYCSRGNLRCFVVSNCMETLASKVYQYASGNATWSALDLHGTTPVASRLHATVSDKSCVVEISFYGDIGFKCAKYT